MQITLRQTGCFLIVFVAFGLNGLEAQTADLKPVPPVVACSGLKGFDLSAVVGAKVQIEAAVEVADAVPAPYCRVTGVIAPAIRFEVRLPLKNWTQRFLQTGCGGLCGTLNINVGRADDCAPATNGELVLASTDTGHRSPGRGGEDGAWAAENPQSKIDFAYRGVHLTAVAAKALTTRYYGRSARYSYFSGCSEGGREALMEAERYPEDFDGIAAGAPAMNFTTQNSFYHGWNAMVNTGADGKAILTAEQLPALHAAAIAACDEADGLKDGLISNPAACRFDPATAVCRDGQAGSACLTAAQARVAKEIYAGAHDSAGHKFVISGPQPGSELAWDGVYVPRTADQPIFSAGIARASIRYLAYDKPLAPEFQLRDFHFDQATFDAIRPMHPIYDATDPDLSRFAAHGGRLLMFHGWSDPHISPLNSIAYYTAMERVMGEAKTNELARLFLFPGGYHCNGGDGPFAFPLLRILMDWVEKGTAPEHIDAAQVRGGGRGAAASPAVVERTRTVFPYPAVAAYRGTGDVNSAASFVKKAAPRLPAEQLQWQGGGFYAAGYEKWCEWDGAAMKCGAVAK